jgi:hypothetical protein
MKVIIDRGASPLLLKRWPHMGQKRASFVARPRSLRISSTIIAAKAMPKRNPQFIMSINVVAFRILAIRFRKALLPWLSFSICESIVYLLSIRGVKKENSHYMLKFNPLQRASPNFWTRPSAMTPAR